MATAAELYDLRIQRGRLLRGTPLAWACALRNLLFGFMLEGEGDDDLGAPAWIVVTDRRTGARVGRVSVGREAHAAVAQLAAMESDAARLAPEAFIERHKIR